MTSLNKSYKTLIYQLITDRLFWLAILLAPLVLWLLTTVIDIPNPSISNVEVIVLTILVFPVLEELVFRGQLQAFLLKFFSPKKLGISQANIITSIIFAALHLIYQDPFWAISIFIPSLIFGFFFEKYQSVLPSIVLHASYNAMFLYHL